MAPVLGVLVAFWSVGCAPRCQETCNTVLDCGIETTRLAKDECVLSCRLQEELYVQWEDEEKIDAFRAHKRCIRSSTCDEIAAGTCYDELLFVLEPQSPVGG